MRELTQLIKQKKEKIVGIFKKLLPDKKKEIELIQNLVITHLEYTKAKKQSLPSVPLRRQRDEIRDELEELLGNSLEEEIESSLNDCEELVAWELELEEKFSKKTSLDFFFTINVHYNHHHINRRLHLQNRNHRQARCDFQI